MINENENENVFTEKNIIRLIENPIINTYSTIEYGKSMATINEHYVRFNINNYVGSKIMLGDNDYEELKKHNVDVSNNGTGFDSFNINNSKRYQNKFRQVTGKMPYSKQLHFENTRRHSKKNNNSSSNSGHVVYSINEFDYVIFTICHIVNGVRPNYKEWSFSLIPIEKLEDPNNIGYCLPQIPSILVKEYFISNIDELCKKFK